MPHLPQGAATRQPGRRVPTGAVGLAGPAGRGGAAGASGAGGGEGTEPSHPRHVGAAVPRTLALQTGASQGEKTETNGCRRGPGSMPPLPADAPRPRYSPSAAARTCRSINRFYNLMQQLPASRGQMPPQNHLPPCPLPLEGPQWLGLGFPLGQRPPAGPGLLLSGVATRNCLLWDFPAVQSGFPIGQA